MAKNTFLDWDQTASNNTDIGGISILGTAAVNNFDDAFRTAMAQLRAGVDGEVVYAAKSGNYTAVLNDNNAWHRYTATATITLTAAATLGAGWHYTVTAEGLSTVLTIDPNGSETIGGVTTLVLHCGQTAFIICDGTNFRVEIRGTSYVVQSGGYTALVGDNGTNQRFTATATLALTAAATLGPTWRMTVIADGADVTVDPNASETINGVATLTVPNGSTAEIICDGSNFFTVMKPFGWEVVPGGHVVTSGVASVAFTNLGSFRRLWIVGQISPVSVASIYYQTSTNNGSSYDQGASDYTHQYIQSSGAAVAALRASASAGAISANTSNGVIFSMVIDNFNASTGSAATTTTQVLSGGTIVLETTTSSRTSATARNAFRLITGAATLACDVTVLGMRG